MLVTTHKTQVLVYWLSWLTLCSIVSHKHTFRTFDDANFVIELEKSTDDVTLFSIDIMAKPTSLSGVIDERRYVLINFSFEKERSACIADGTFTGTLSIICTSTDKSGNTSCKHDCHTNSVKHQVVNKRRRCFSWENLLVSQESCSILLFYMLHCS